MRIKTFTQGGYMDGGFTSGGGTMTGPLILSGEPTKELEAATKQYVDTKTATFDAVKFTSGTLQVGRLPAFTGDVVSSTGSNSLSLAPTGVSAGVYTKVTVNAKGLITGGGSLTESDLPDLDWAKFTSGKPTNLSGYGITDAIALSGGAVSGNLTLHADPVNANHLVTKQYVDNNAGGATALKTGDIVSKMSSTTPTGFLRCNGGKVAKASYPALYAVLGDAHTYVLTPGNGIPWKSQATIENLSGGNTVGAWTQGTTPLPQTLHKPAVFVTRNKVHFLSNYQSTNTSGGGAGHYVADLYGTMSSMVRVDEIQNHAYGARAVVTTNRVYVIGGYAGSSAGSPVMTAEIDANGNTGAFTFVGYMGPGPLIDPEVFVTKGRLYVVGGSNLVNSTTPTPSNKVYTTPIAADGTIGAWTEVTALPVTFHNGGCVVGKNRVYLFGGQINGNSSNAIYSAPINQDGTIGQWTLVGTGPWSNGNEGIFIGTRAGVHVWVNYGNRHYYAPWNADGTLGSWNFDDNQSPSSSVAGAYFVGANRLYCVSTQQWQLTLNTGLDAYHQYYNGTITGVDPNNFGVPDLTAVDLPGSYSYIKT